MGGLALHVILLQLCLAALVHSQPQAVLIIPNVLRVESDETVVLEVLNHDTAIDCTITMYDFPQKKQTLYTTKMTVDPNNKFLGTAQVTVPSKDLKKDAKSKQFVYVTAKCPLFEVEKVVLVSFHSGYIFIQTDKTIYTPGSTVYYRLFTMGHKLQPVSKPLIVEFETPEGIIVKRDIVVGPRGAANSGGIFSESHKLPEIVNMGTWTIVARFEDSPLQNYTTSFDVKEYVLPSFEVIVVPKTPYYYLDGNELDVAITARYLYGKPVDGDAFVLFGVLFDDEKKSIPQSLRRVEIRDGHGVAKLTRQMLSERFEKLEELLSHRIYVSVTVITASGSDMVEAEKTDIYIVTSPYKVLFTKTPKYFKPGMPFELMVFVTNPDGSPAKRIPVIATPGNVEGTTQGDGTTKLTINTSPDISSLQITVETKSSMLPDNRQFKATMTVSAYRPQGNSKNFLHIGVTANELKPGDNLNVNFNVRNTDAATQNQYRHFTYLLINRGKIFKVGKQDRQPGQALVTMTLPITPDLIPSFRIIAYYYVANEIVSDSIWVDVKDSCMGTLVVSGATAADNKVHEPGKSMRLMVKGDHKAKVGLVAVDKGVYVLNPKHKISQTKVWDSVEKNDIGCTPGGGANNVGVFSDAGLALETSFKTSTPQRAEPFCPQPGKRKRRSVTLIEYKAGKAAKFKGRPKKCCEDGMQENLMGHSCQKRSRNIRDTEECVNAFLECCQEISKVRAERRREQLFLARSDVDEGYLSEEDVISRTEFPESWFWKVEDLLDKPDNEGISSKTMTVFLKDSITTWEVLAVSLSENKGICIADPYEITVFKKFFIDLRLPYSVVRNEQVEIRAVLYNYENEHDNIKVRIELMYNEKFCSASTARKKFRQELEMAGKTSRSVSFIIVPLETGLHDIEVKAYVFGSYVADGVRKKLKVVPEGMKMTKTVKVVTLDPVTKGKDGVQEEKIQAADLKDIVPKTESETIVSVLGNPVSQLIENSIDGANLHHLIIVPSGCGEQNMISMTPGVIATHYLDNTGQWEKLGVNRRSDAIKYIKQGYTQQLVYRQSDSSYAAWANQPPGSTWLTAYVSKIFAMADNFIDIQKDVLCGAVKWLILNRQNPDGIFREDRHVYHAEMVGGTKTREPEASLTAFVLIALAESKKACAQLVPSLEGSIEKAANYLEKKYPTLARPYAVAITAYALAIVDRLPKVDKLMEASTDQTHWNDPENRMFSIESTSYALLALTHSKNFEPTNGIVRWLNEQKYYGGGYGSTQATVMVFQALAQYTMDAPGLQDLELDVSMKLPGRKTVISYKISNENAMVARSAETKQNGDFTVEAKGTGQGTLTVVTVYNALLSDKDAPCKNFDLSVTIKSDNLAKKPEGAFSTVLIEVCTRYRGSIDSTMTILDISMLTGFSPDLEDLRKLSEPVDRYISKFEIDKGLADKGKLILYLDHVSHMENDCISFKAHQFFQVGLIQPAAVTVYDYYNLAFRDKVDLEFVKGLSEGYEPGRTQLVQEILYLGQGVCIILADDVEVPIVCTESDSRCTKFYHPDKESGLLSKICQGDICRCAEENCYMQKLADDIDVNRRVEEACAPGVDYVYKAKLTKVEKSDNYDNYLMTIVEVIKSGSDEAPKGKIRRFISHQKCRDALKLKIDKDYLIWGLNSDLWDHQNEIAYIIGKDTWIEWWPNQEECQQPAHVDICQDFVTFAENVMIFGCPN